MINFFEKDKKENRQYIKLILAVSKLSRLFSNSDTPYIYYRAMENLFCYCFNAKNLSRSDTAFDAKINNIGIGLKTFLGDGKKYSFEKIAEFNKLSTNIHNSKDNEKLISYVSELRNNRIDIANGLYGIDKALYHIIVRRKNKLIFFESDYDKINISNVKIINNKQHIIDFTDGIHFYKYNLSKSTLFRKFDIPENINQVETVILDNPAELLLKMENFIDKLKIKEPEREYIILPLYTFQKGKKIVQEKSALNQWNAEGRKRDPDEVYISIPALIRKNFPNFFPKRKENFIIKTPLGETLNASICQDNGKALMTNPNKALSNWLLRTALGLQKYELATIEKLENCNIDSVILEKEKEYVYNIDVRPIGSYEKFIDKIENKDNIELE